MNEWIKNYLNNYSIPKIIYDLDVIKQKLLFIREASKAYNINILFAVKSFPHPKILSLICSYVDGFEISNIREYSLLPKNDSYKFISVNDPTINLKDIPIYTSDNHKTIYYNLDYIDDSVIDELLILNHNNANIKFGIRLSHTELGISSQYYRTGIESSRFGINLEKTREIIKENKIISGLHLHNGSEINNVESYLLIANKMIAFLEENNFNVSYINFGGGLHTLSDNEILILFMELNNIVPEKWKIYFEPGHLFSANAGYAIAKIAHIKEVGLERYIVTTDMSYECSLKWSIPKYYPLQISSFEKCVDVSFYGSTCYEHDLILRCKIDFDNFIQHIVKDKLVIFNNINGYALAWSHSFNGIAKAQIYFHDSSI